MKLKEFTKPDYNNMPDEELSQRIQTSLNAIEELLDRSIKDNESGLRHTDSKNIREVSSD